MRKFQSLEAWIVCFVRVGLAQGKFGRSLSSHSNPGSEANFHSNPLKQAGGANEPKSWLFQGNQGYWSPRHSKMSLSQTSRSRVHQAHQQQGDVYIFDVTIAHFAVELREYDRASATGNDTFHLKNGDNGWFLELDLALNTTCCSQDFYSTVNQDVMILQCSSHLGPATGQPRKKSKVWTCQSSRLKFCAMR